MTRAAIIGTAGRHSQHLRLSADIFERMCRKAAELVTPGDDLQSGGAAWADHVAVVLFLAGRACSLTLYLPCEFDLRSARFVEASQDRLDPGRIINYYHDLFTMRAGWRSMVMIAEAVRAGAKLVVVPGFRNRNIPVGDCDWLLAFTFERARFPGGNGTRHCWNNSTARQRLHIPIDSLR